MGDAGGFDWAAWFAATFARTGRDLRVVAEMAPETQVSAGHALAAFRLTFSTDLSFVCLIVWATIPDMLAGTDVHIAGALAPGEE